MSIEYYARAINLIRSEREALTQTLRGLEREEKRLHRLNSSLAIEPENGRLLTLAESIDLVLEQSAGPISVAEMRKRLGAMPLKARIEDRSVRSVLVRRAADMGWQKLGRGMSVLWKKSSAPTEHSEPNRLEVSDVK